MLDLVDLPPLRARRDLDVVAVDRGVAQPPPHDLPVPEQPRRSAVTADEVPVGPRDPLHGSHPGQPRRWQRPHQYRLRPSSTALRTIDPQTRQDWPWRR